MKKMFLVAGAAVMALAAPALADKGGHGGGNHGGGNGGNHGGGHGGAMHGGGHGDGQMRGGGARHPDGGRPMAYLSQEGRGHGADRDRSPQRFHAERKVDRAIARDRYDHDRLERAQGRDDRAYPVRLVEGDRAGEGCPPGLAMKHNGCLPPGQAKKLLGTRIDNRLLAAALPPAYSNWYRDDDDYYYRYNDGYMYRIDRSNQLVSGLFPLFGDAYYPVGTAYPSPYNFYNVPVQYRDYYPAQADYSYRYGNGAIYALDPQTNLVNSIVALVAGDLAVGQPMPSAYSVYNVPLDYRGQYADTANDWYRYNDGYIYRVDPATQLVTAMVQAIL